MFLKNTYQSTQTSTSQISSIQQIQDIIKTLSNLDQDKSNNPQYVQNQLISHGLEMNLDVVWKPDLTFANSRQKINYLVATVVLYGLTRQYPESIWNDELFSCYDSLFLNKISDSALKNDRDLAIFSEKFDTLYSQLRTYVMYRARKRLNSFCRVNVKVAEMLVRCFITKYYMFSPELWISALDEMKPENKSVYNIRPDTDVDLKTGFCEGHSISVQGERHITCDDYSGVFTLEDDVMLAFSADGVGSSALSRYGSRAAGKALEQCFTLKFSPSKSSIGDLLQYLYTDFPRDLEELWEQNIFDENGQQLPPQECLTSLLFTLVCSKIVVCGMVGDGVFVVEKTERKEDRVYQGYFRLTDGVSGVTSKGIQHLLMLKSNPCALRIQIFSSSEVSSVVMASDGAEGLLYENIGGSLTAFEDVLHSRPYIQALNNTPYEERKELMKKLAFRYSRSNSTAWGMNDDCSIVYVGIPKNIILNGDVSLNIIPDDEDILEIVTPTDTELGHTGSENDHKADSATDGEIMKNESLSDEVTESEVGESQPSDNKIIEEVTSENKVSGDEKLNTEQVENLSTENASLETKISEDKASAGEIFETENPEKQFTEDVDGKKETFEPQSSENKTTTDDYPRLEVSENNSLSSEISDSKSLAPSSSKADPSEMKNIETSTHQIENVESESTNQETQGVKALMNKIFNQECRK